MSEIGVRLLMTDVCNLQCVFCHNEFQAKAPPARCFDSVSLERILGDAARRARTITVKFSGGEPLLKKSELPELLALVKRHPQVDRVMLISNLQVPLRPAEMVELVSAGVGHVRANIPSFDATTYRERVGGHGSLKRALERLGAFHELGARTEVTCVVDAVSGEDLMQFIETESSRARDFPFIEKVRVVQNAYLTRTLVDWTDQLQEGGFSRLDRRCWAREGRPVVEVTSCDDWDGRAVPTEADWYVQPPGIRLTALVPNHARRVDKGDI